MVGKATKKSGPSPGTGNTKTQNGRNAVKALKTVQEKKSIIGSINVEMHAGIDWRVVVGVTPKLFVYLGYTDSNVGQFFDTYEDDTNKIFSALKTRADVEGTANQPARGTKRRGSKRRRGREICLLLPEPYPLNEIGGDNGTKGNNSADSGSKRAPSETMSLWVPNQVPLLGVGIFLHYLNNNATKQDRKIVEFCTRTSIDNKAIPQAPDELARDVAALAKVSES